jgi:hypothetical protein
MDVEVADILTSLAVVEEKNLWPNDHIWFRRIWREQDPSNPVLFIIWNIVWSFLPVSTLSIPFTLCQDTNGLSPDTYVFSTRHKSSANRSEFTLAINVYPTLFNTCYPKQREEVISEAIPLWQNGTRDPKYGQCLVSEYTSIPPNLLIDKITWEKAPGLVPTVCDPRASHKKNIQQRIKTHSITTTESKQLPPWWCCVRFRTDNAGSRVSQSYLRLAVGHESRCLIDVSSLSPLVQNLISGEWRLVVQYAKHNKRGLGQFSAPLPIQTRPSFNESVMMEIDGIASFTSTKNEQNHFSSSKKRRLEQDVKEDNSTTAAVKLYDSFASYIQYKTKETRQPPSDIAAVVSKALSTTFSSSSSSSSSSSRSLVDTFLFLLTRK